MQHSGIEKLTVQFAWGERGADAGRPVRGGQGRPSTCASPNTPVPPSLTCAAALYPEHLKTGGYNAIAITSVTNCWVRNVSARGLCSLPAASCLMPCRCRGLRSPAVSVTLASTGPVLAHRTRRPSAPPPASNTHQKQVNIIDADNGVIVTMSDFITVNRKCHLIEAEAAWLAGWPGWLPARVAGC